jgi:hypothetical protein
MGVIGGAVLHFTKHLVESVFHDVAKGVGVRRGQSLWCLARGRLCTGQRITQDFKRVEVILWRGRRGLRVEGSIGMFVWYLTPTTNYDAKSVRGPVVRTTDGLSFPVVDGVVVRRCWRARSPHLVVRKQRWR